jgi:repressor LexA
MAQNVLGPVIKQLRRQKGLTQRELSRITGLSQNAISNHENQNRSLDEKDIHTYAQALGTTPQEMFNLVSSEDNMKSDLIFTFDQLDTERQKRVIGFAHLQLDQQRQPSNVKELYPDTLAAHADDIDHEYTPEELKHNIDFLDEQIDKYNRKHKK